MTCQYWPQSWVGILSVFASVMPAAACIRYCLAILNDSWIVICMTVSEILMIHLSGSVWNTTGTIYSRFVWQYLLYCISVLLYIHMYGSVCYTHYSQNSVAILLYILLYIIYSWFVWQCPLYFYLYGSTYTLYCILYLSDSVRYTTVYSWFVWLFARYYIHYLFVSIDYIHNLFCHGSLHPIEEGWN